MNQDQFEELLLPALKAGFQQVLDNSIALMDSNLGTILLIWSLGYIVKFAVDVFTAMNRTMI